MHASHLSIFMHMSSFNTKKKLYTFSNRAQLIAIVCDGAPKCISSRSFMYRIDFSEFFLSYFLLLYARSLSAALHRNFSSISFFVGSYMVFVSVFFSFFI